MAMFTAPGAYDRAITVFSPDGRLFQVEYALETVKRGSTVMGIACPEGVVLAAEERSTSRLQDPEFSWKIFQIDEHVGAAISGLSSDARILINQARIYAQGNRLTYDELADIEVLSKRVGDIKQMYTQHAGVRPFGVSMIFGGVDKNGSKIFTTDPSGSYRAWKGVSMGIGREAVEKTLREEYRENLSLDEAIGLAVKCLVGSLKTRGEEPKLKIAVIPTDTKRFRQLATEEVDEFVKSVEGSGTG